ncbi:hypothetical protein HOLleu_04392 [Holothuria leucospilota]|uniref:Uncharacterized protein n=1 Tax=Holothuria leucospilota TaxID=206669 RepID=A0A9Q1CTT0_HOLLE|nr:hypothetical protein HOLleu_04392 [Holothuria leucospilota]
METSIRACVSTPAMRDISYPILSLLSSSVKESTGVGRNHFVWLYQKTREPPS